jgi:hypothetical protein
MAPDLDARTLGCPVGEIVWLARYPVKSMPGEALDRADPSESGVDGDRRFALVDTETGRGGQRQGPAQVAGSARLVGADGIAAAMPAGIATAMMIDRAGHYSQVQYPAGSSRSCCSLTKGCACRKPHPRRSGGMFVFVEDAAEPIASLDPEPGYLVRVGERRGQWVQRPGVGEALVRPVAVVERFEFVQGVQQMSLVPDQGSVQQFVAACPYPAFHD